MRLFIIIFWGMFPLASECVAKPLNILFVVGNFPVLPETFIINQITGLIDRGHNIDIFSLSRGNSSKVHHDVIEYKLLDRTTYKIIPKNLNKYDIILCQFGPLGKQFVNHRKKLNFKAKIVTCFRGYDMSQTIRYNGPDVYRQLFKEGDLFLPVCDYFKEKLINLGCDPKKIMVHHSAIDPARFMFVSDRSDRVDTAHIVSVCRLVPKKGIEYAIRAVGELVKKYPSLQYHIVGNGMLKEKLGRLIAQQKLEKNVKLLGWKTQKEVIEELNDADLVVLPSVTAQDGNEEGIPNALKEPMSMGIPVVGTYHAGLEELIKDDVSGYLVEQRDVSELALKMDLLIANPGIRKRMGVEGRKTIEEEYDVEKLNDRLVEIFYALLEA